MNRKIVFFDIDGTLLNEKKEIPESTRKAVKLLQDKGIYTAIATGRIPAAFDWVRKELKIESYVSINGQYVVFEGKTIYDNPLDPETVAGMTSLALNSGHAMAYCNPQEIGVTHDRHPLIKESFGIIYKKPPTHDREFYLKHPVYQCNLFVREEDEAGYTDSFPEYRLVRWHESAVDVLPAGISKAIGIEKFLHAVGIPNEHCYAFGDGLNDIEMLSSVGIGVAMGNAEPEAKAAATLVTSSCSEDGILNGLGMVGLL
jgi:Cof subfamily protein (haloacid dehalogenase superfamily)